MTIDLEEIKKKRELFIQNRRQQSFNEIKEVLIEKGFVSLTSDPTPTSHPRHLLISGEDWDYFMKLLEGGGLDRYGHGKFKIPNDET